MYDRYGNRTGVTATGNTAKVEKPMEPQASNPMAELALKNEVRVPADLSASKEGMLSDSASGIRLLNGTESAHATAANKSAAASTSAPLLPQSTPTFTDDPLTAGVAIKAVHVTELRTAINQLRAHAGLQAATWTDDPLTVGVTTVKAVHITEMRARLDEARTALGLTNSAYTDSILTAGSTIIKAVHIQELRDRVKSAWSVTPQVPRAGLLTLT